MRTLTISRLLRGAGAAAAVLALTAGAAQAATPHKSAHAPTSAAKTSAQTAPVKIKYARVHLAQLFSVGGHDMTLAKRSVHMTAQVAPFVAGQWLRVTISVLYVDSALAQYSIKFF